MLFHQAIILFKLKVHNRYGLVAADYWKIIRIQFREWGAIIQFARQFAALDYFYIVWAYSYFISHETEYIACLQLRWLFNLFPLIYF